MKQVDLKSGTIEYDDSGEGPPVVLLHGVLMNHTQWDLVLPHLPEGFRYVRPVLPLGAHTIALPQDADRSLEGQVQRLAELLEALDLDGVTLVHTDWGGGLFLTASGLDERVSSLIILPCEAFDNFPPGIPGKLLRLSARIPGGMSMALRQLRISWIRGLPPLFGQMAKRPLADDLVRGWTGPAINDKAVRQDLVAYSAGRSDPERFIASTQALTAFRGPVLILWSPETKVMPADHGPRLAKLMPQATYVEVDDAYVLSMLDRPEYIAAKMTDFLLQHRGVRRN